MLSNSEGVLNIMTLISLHMKLYYYTLNAIIRLLPNQASKHVKQ